MSSHRTASHEADRGVWERVLVRGALLTPPVLLGVWFGMSAMAWVLWHTA